ncbi:MAG: hypothetical protein JSW07_18995 [bacterium]|nr:MAG: hypothetical protein JSW07_18995 [bacterium]
MRVCRIFLFSVTILIIFLLTVDTFAQGISRSSGIGLRIGSWNVTNHPTRISTTGYGKDAVVDIGGAGAWIYFFSRLYNNWFFEFNMGAVGGVHEEHTEYIVKNTEVSAIIPVLFGLRNDLISTRLPTAFQPYLSLGGGPYWTTSVKSEDIHVGGQQSVESSLKYGAYTGVGINILVASWFAFNFDLKYHFVDFEFEKDYSGLEFSGGFSLMWGRKREIFQIKGIRPIVSDIYPAYYQFYNTYPLALVSIKNVAGYPIEVNIRSYIRHYSERSKHSGYIRIKPGKTTDIPATAIFGKQLLQANRREPAILDMEVEARAGRTMKKAVSAQIMIHNRNAWNGEMDKLVFFVTSDNEKILSLTRGIVNQERIKDSNGSTNFHKAQLVFEELRNKGIHYHRDPNILFYKDDRVQFALETLDLGNGDCDDLVVLYASLLESLGINTAFVEVQDPQKEIAHLYLIFDSDLQPNQGYLISSNEKRFVIREGSQDQSRIWIPVETTLIEQGFEQAWKAGATAYLQDGIIRNGIEQGWVRIIDVE